MKRIAISPAASALLRCLAGRARVARDRILLIDVRSVDWRSLTFTGERHQLDLRITGPDSRIIVERMCDRLEDAEFSNPRRDRRRYRAGRKPRPFAGWVDHNQHRSTDDSGRLAERAAQFGKRGRERVGSIGRSTHVARCT